MSWFALGLLALGLAAADGGDLTAHGGFTGDVKPVIYVADVAVSAPFYRDVLGFELDGFAGDGADPYYADMLVGRLKFGLHEPTTAGDGERVGRARLYVRVRSLEAHRRRVEAHGIAVGAVHERDWMDYFVVHDPDGNAIVFGETDPTRHGVDPWRREPLPD